MTLIERHEEWGGGVNSSVVGCALGFEHWYAAALMMTIGPKPNPIFMLFV